VDSIDQVIKRGPFEASWNSLTNYQVPAWYEDGKFGIFIHWGVYCVPAFGNEWYPRNMYIQGTKEFEHHVATHGRHTEFGYKDFIPQLTAANFDADAWAVLFKQAGAKFVVPVAEHHDGFQMYDSTLSEWNAARMGPKRDIVGELAAATRKHGMVFGVSSHRAEHWFFFDGGTKFESDVQDPGYAGLYGPAQPAPTDFHGPQSTTRPSQEYLNDWFARTCELVDKYQPQLVWFDWWIENAAFEPYLRRFAAYYYNRGAQWGRGVAINHKYAAFPAGAAVFDIERGQVSDIYPRFWQNDTSVSKNSWGYVTNHDYKTVDSIVDDLVDVVSKNGALLLNIGPRPDGTIPEPEQQMLREIGAWLALNGEAIYGSRPWKVFGEGPTQVSEGAFTDTKRAAFTGEDIRFTIKGDTLYAIALAWPGEQLTIKSLGTSAGLLGGEVAGVELLGHAGSLIWERGEHGLTIALPEQLPCQHAFTFKIISR
jgi:alpha-L-fucosidase